VVSWIGEHLAAFLFVTLAALLFTGYPVAFVLGGIAIFFGAIGILFDVFQPMQFFNLLPRIWGGVAANPILVAVPMFIFMGTALERSGVANDLLHALQVITARSAGMLKRLLPIASRMEPSAPTPDASVGVAQPAKMLPSTSVMRKVGGRKLLRIMLQNSAAFFGPTSAGSGGASPGFQKLSAPIYIR